LVQIGLGSAPLAVVSGIGNAFDPALPIDNAGASQFVNTFAVFIAGVQHHGITLFATTDFANRLLRVPIGCKSVVADPAFLKGIHRSNAHATLLYEAPLVERVATIAVTVANVRGAAEQITSACRSLGSIGPLCGSQRRIAPQTVVVRVDGSSIEDAVVNHAESSLFVQAFVKAVAHVLRREVAVVFAKTPLCGCHILGG